MQRAFPLIVIAVLLAACAASRPAALRDADRAAIEAAYDDWYEAWRTKDPVLAAAHFSDDAHFVNAFGMHCAGRAEIEALLGNVFDMDFVMAGESETVQRDIRFLAENVALVTSQIRRVGQLDPDGRPLGDRKTSHLRVFERREVRWVIVDHLISDARSTETPEH